MARRNPLFGAAVLVAVGITPGRVPAVGPDGYLPPSVIPPISSVSLGGLGNQAANVVLAGPTAGPNAIPTFRTLGVFDVLGLQTALDNKLSALALSGVAWVDPVNGSNTTGTLGRLDKPFLTVAAAVTACSGATISSPRIVWLMPATYALGDAVINLPNDVSLYGYGINNTVITSTADSTVRGAIVKPGSRSVVRNLTIQGIAANPTLQYPIGMDSVLGQAPFSDATVYNVRLIGNTDGVYIRSSVTAVTAKFIDIQSQSKYDCCNIDTCAANTVIEFYNLDFTTDASGQSNVARGLIVQNSIAGSVRVRVFGGRIKAANGLGTTVAAINADGVAVMELHGVRLESSSTRGGIICDWLNSIGTSAKMIVGNCSYDPAKTFDTPFTEASPYTTNAGAIVAITASDNTFTGLNTFNQVVTIAAVGAGDVDNLIFNNTDDQNPVVRWNPVLGGGALKFFSSTTLVAQLKDDGTLTAGGLWVGPTAFTGSGTAYFYDATATTGATVVTVRGGAGQSSGTMVFHVLTSAGAETGIKGYNDGVFEVSKLTAVKTIDAGVVTASVLAAGTYTPDFSSGQTFQLDAAGNFTLANPTNVTNGQRRVIAVRNTSGGAITITFGANYRTGTNIAVAQVATGKTDYLGVLYTTQGAVTKAEILAYDPGH